MDERIANYVEEALERMALGLDLELGELCRDHPELIPEVEALLRLDQELSFKTPVDPLIGQTFDQRYEIHECIGAGAMGAVYAATDRSLGRDVAVKVLHQGIFASDQRHRRFVREAKVLASMDHGHVVAVFDHGCSEQGHHYIVMERLHGAPLAPILQQAENDSSDPGFGFGMADWLRAHFEIEAQDRDYIPQVMQWSGQLADALVAAHRAGVTHRDVKPSNIFVGLTGDAVLLDFGIAAKMGDGSLTAAGTTIGSPWNMAPEQATNRDIATELVDVYGLCATLYHLVTFRPPYEGDYAEVLGKLSSIDPAPPGQLRPELSRDLCAVIEKGMERNPAHRYQSMVDLRDDLRALCAQLPVTARPISKASRFLRRVKRRPAPAIGVASVMLALAIAIPVALSWQNVAQAQRVDQDRRYLDLLAGLPPSVAIEGSLELRPELDPVERADHIATLSEMLELRPEDDLSRLLRAALFQDQGDHDASAADLVAIRDRAPSQYLNELVRRYDDVDGSTKGILAVKLEGLPTPQTDADRLVAGFHSYRRKEYSDADAHLAPALSFHARYLRLALTERNVRGDAAKVEAALREADGLQKLIGRTTARLDYLRGTMLLTIERFHAAQVPMRRSLDLCARSFGTNFNLGYILRMRDQHEAALACYQRAMALRPANLNARVRAVQVLTGLERFEEAELAVVEIPDAGFLLEPWQKTQLEGLIEARRSTFHLAKGDLDGMRASARAALTRYRASLARIPATETRARRWLEEDIRVMERCAASSGTPADLAVDLFAALKQDPTDELALRALNQLIPLLEIDPKVRPGLKRTMEQLTERIRQYRSERNK